MSVAKWKTAYGKTLPVEERIWLKNLATAVSRSFDNPMIVNIGVFRYATMYCLRAGAPDARMFGIDIKKPDVKMDPKLNARIAVADSTKFWRTFKSPIHLLFIDGDHHYEGVKADIAGWVPKVVPGGVVAFHDYAPTPYHMQLLPMLEGVRRAVSEWQEDAGWVPMQGPKSLQGFRRPK